MQRRDFLTISAGAILLPTRGFTASSLMLGDGKLTTLSDGHLVLPGDFVLGNMDPAEAAAIRAKFHLDPDSYQPPCNVTLFRTGDRNVLFDVGSGPDFMPTAGKLAEALTAASLTPEDITDVIFTHAHPDHLWGLLDEFDEPVFANAQHYMGQVEFDYWSDPATLGSIGDARATFAVGAARRLATIAEQMHMLNDGDEPLPGITTRLTPGHTPGHMSFILDGKALVTGDAISNNHVAFAQPGYASPSDQDPERAAQTRVALLDQITADGLAVIGFHLPGGGVGQVTREGDSYTYVEG
ncbi:MBL fold metallo-hydrolase [Pseudorhodobacter sp.]|uniref:MBL fold metallo-hydrolase n=1 Tax=Pseudorhodobacter sp. TaxID=1934400 RepID=UPI002648DE4D|nr:MBL fold metallo-hydrolase [Pseudorhodobacter sp.]MDN5786768.1 MBL fold metallo-hydrolase [Pseudorhodobacter sp.]